MSEPTTVCGRAEYHGGRHGSWVKEAVSWQCGKEAVPRIKMSSRTGDWTCLECWGDFEDHIQAAQHWWRSHVRLRVLKPIDHGTEHGYHMHWRRQETACRQCKDAHAAHARGERL